MIDELFRRAKKYVMLEEDLQATASHLSINASSTGKKRYRE